MTEQEWLASENPAVMLERLKHSDLWTSFAPPKGPISDRKLRLFACEWYTYLIPPNHKVLEVVEAVRQWADGKLTRQEALISPGMDVGFRDNWYLFREIHACLDAISTSPLLRKSLKEVASLLREIVGNPWRPVTLPTEQLKCQCGGEYGMLKKDFLPMLSQCQRCRGDGPFWPDVKKGRPCPWLTHNDGAVLKLAQAIYDSRTWDELPILRDALIEAGCDNEELLRHLDGEELCPRCGGKRLLVNAEKVAQMFDRPMSNERAQSLLAGIRAGIIATKYCSCGSGWMPLRGPHVRGCWALDLLLGKS